jgi:hypothetical protein
VQTIDCDLIEQHVRQVHLGRTAARSHDEDTDHEEEFYYTEFDIPEQEEEDEDEDGSLVVEESRHEEEEEEEDDEDETMTAATATEAGGSSVSATTPASQQLVSMTNPYCQAPAAAFSAGTVETLVPLLADHCDMARPPHENPEYAAAAHQQGNLPFFSSILSRFLSYLFPSVRSFRRITCKILFISIHLLL